MMGIEFCMWFVFSLTLLLAFYLVISLVLKVLKSGFWSRTARYVLLTFVLIMFVIHMSIIIILFFMVK